MDKTIEKGISDLVGCLSDPIIVLPEGWGDTLPEWLKNAITLERLAMNMRASKGELPTGTDAEAFAYLNTASHPLAPLGGGGTSTVGRERAKRHQKKEEEAARREAEQPALFQF